LEKRADRGRGRSGGQRKKCPNNACTYEYMNKEKKKYKEKKEHKQQQMLMRMWEERNLHTLLVGIKLLQPLWTTVWRLLKKKLNIELQYYS
jgi:hypothetical protein